MTMLNIFPYPVAAETRLEEWNIALIGIGVIIYVIGICIAAILGTVLCLKANNLSGMYIQCRFSCMFTKVYH